jgi:hypothetical protein
MPVPGPDPGIVAGIREEGEGILKKSFPGRILWSIPDVTEGVPTA